MQPVKTLDEPYPALCSKYQAEPNGGHTKPTQRMLKVTPTPALQAELAARIARARLNGTYDPRYEPPGWYKP